MTVLKVWYLEICLEHCIWFHLNSDYRLAAVDVVITTYNIVQREVKLPDSLKKDKAEQDKPADDVEVAWQPLFPVHL